MSTPDSAPRRHRMLRVEAIQLFFLLAFYPWVAFVVLVATAAPIVLSVMYARRSRR